jgi:HK97 family phage major capsid protein
MDESKVIELQGLLKELREKHEEMKANVITKADFAERAEKLNARIDELETALNRPGGGEGDKGNSGDDAKEVSKKAFFEYMRHGKAELGPDQRKALVADAEGQILIPEALEAEIYRELPKLTVMRGLATVQTINSDRIRRRSMTELTVGWGKLETGSVLVESDVVLSEAYQYIENLNGLTKVGVDELSDSDVAIEALLRDSFARAFAEAEDSAFITGTGHASLQPEGILNGSTVTRVTAGQVADVTYDDLIEILYAVPEQYARNGAWIMNRTTEKHFRAMVDLNNRPLWEPSLQAGGPNMLLGYPVYQQADVPAIPASGTAADVLIFGDVRAGYRILDRAGVAAQRLTELYAEQDLVGVKVKKRVGGGVIRANALRILEVPAV